MYHMPLSYTGSVFLLILRYFFNGRMFLFPYLNHCSHFEKVEPYFKIQ